MKQMADEQICLSCNACCKVTHIPTLFKPTDFMIHFYRERGFTVKIANGVLYLEVDGDCPNLTLMGCKIYDARPYVCRQFFGYDSPIESIREVCKLERR